VKVSGFSECVKQFKTHARIVAEADPRNAYSMYLKSKAFCSQLFPEMIFNWNATQYVVNSDGDESGIFIKAELPSDRDLSGESGGGLDFAMKLYHFHNAAGFCSPPVFVIADNSMSEGEYKVFKIDRLNSDRSMDSYGYLCFTKTRACNSTFYKWFVFNVVVPYITERREKRSCKVRKCQSKEEHNQ
jgi:hypothetical protein